MLNLHLALHDLGEYWKTAEGIEARFQMLVRKIAFKTYNNAVKLLASAMPEVEGLQISGPADEKTCAYCAQFIGRVYRFHQFMPFLPAHPFCRHIWEVVLKA